MADRLDYFFRQLLTEAELDEGFDKMEAADQKIMTDQILTGIFIGGEVVEHFPAPDLTVDLAGPMNAYDQLGRRLFFSVLQVLDMSVDELAASTAVGTPGNEKILTIFVQFDRNLSDPRLDGNNNTVFFQRAESFKLNVVQSAEAAIGFAVLPAPRVDQLILADVTIVNAQTTILDADIDSDRRADAFNLTGAPTAIRTGRVKTALQLMLDLINAAAAGGSDISEGGDLIVDFSTLQTAIQDLAEQSHVGIDHVFGSEAFIPDPGGAGPFAYNAGTRAWSSTVNGDVIHGHVSMQKDHKVIEVEVYCGDGGATETLTVALHTMNMLTAGLSAALDTQVTDGTGTQQALAFSFTAFTLEDFEEIIFVCTNTGGGAGTRIARGGRIKARRLS